MICPKCKSYNLFVVDSRNTNETTRRRRLCANCGYRFSTVEIGVEEQEEMKGRKKMKVVLDTGAFMPTRAHDTDAGLDLYAMEDAVVYPYSSHCFDTGVHIAIPAGFCGFLKSKSGLNVNHGITSEGVIDSGYTGSIMVKLYNHTKEGVHIKKGQKISQLVILPCVLCNLELVAKLEKTERGSGGFGSTGKF